jgi:hypothetical protein
MNKRIISDVITEALIIGLMNAAIIWLLIKINLSLSDPMKYIIAGALIHLIFEYTGGNKWWCTQTYKP